MAAILTKGIANQVLNVDIILKRGLSFYNSTGNLLYKVNPDILGRREISRKFYEEMSSTASASTDSVQKGGNDETLVDIYVQTLPVLVYKEKVEESSLENETAIQRKVLLCKWNSGNFEGRYTGLITSLRGQQCQLIRKMGQSERHVALLEIAKDLTPKQLSPYLGPMELVGLLRFEDPPACDEYIYLANLRTDVGEVADFNKSVPYGEHSLFWFDWDKIPYHEMPADDALWYPKVLWDKQKVTGSFTFGGLAEKSIKSYFVNVVDQIK